MVAFPTIRPSCGRSWRGFSWGCSSPVSRAPRTGRSEMGRWVMGRWGTPAASAGTRRSTSTCARTGTRRRISRRVPTAGGSDFRSGPHRQGPARLRHPYQKGGALNPYRQNWLKGDYPVAGQNTFLVLTLISDTTVEVRDLPTPAAISTNEPNTPRFFGSGEQFFVVQNVVTSFELFHGNTAFKPADWIVRLTPVFQVNYLDVMGEQRGQHRRAPRHHAHGPPRGAAGGVHREAHPRLLVELRLSLRHRRDPAVVADPRALLFFDNNLGVRAAANWDNNRSQANLAAFYMLEKDTNSELNRFRARNQVVVVANFFRQDFLAFGYTINVTAAWNHDEGDHYKDRNGVPVRPPAVGASTRSEIDVFYLGFTGDGHIGRLNLTHEYFFAFGKNRGNYISGRDLDVAAHMLFVELSYDIDWWRPRISVLVASGDDDPFDGEGTGFDTIADNPNFSGGANSYWIRQGLRVAGTGLVSRLSTFPNLRPSKFEGRRTSSTPACSSRRSASTSTWRSSGARSSTSRTSCSCRRARSSRC